MISKQLQRPVCSWINLISIERMKILSECVSMSYS